MEWSPLDDMTLVWNQAFSHFRWEDASITKPPRHSGSLGFERGQHFPDGLQMALWVHPATHEQDTRVDLPRGLFPALSAVLAGSDLLLAQPDGWVLNNETLQNVLIASFRQRVPVVTFSEPHVRAGATLGLFTAPGDVAVQMMLNGGRR